MSISEITGIPRPTVVRKIKILVRKKYISLECGLQNGTLAVFVATQIFNDVAYMVPTAAYALIMYITGFVFIYILRSSN